MNYQKNKDLVLNELYHVFELVDEEPVAELVRKICSAEKVFVIGVGRVMLMLQAFVKRLNHLGIEATYVGAVDEPAITRQDLLLVGSGSGESIVPLEIIKIAQAYKPVIVHIGSNPNSSMSQYEDLFVRIPCRTKLNLNDEINSAQPMSSLFEQSLLLLLDMAAMMIIEHKKIEDLHSLWRKHANLE